MFEVVLTKLTHEMESATIVEWLKADGDEVEKGEPLVRVETDKATMDMEADAAGRLAGIAVDAGQEVAVGTRLAYLLAEGESVPDEATVQEPSPEAEPRAAGAAPSLSSAPQPVREGPTGESFPLHTGGRVVATPIARRLAREQGIDLKQLTGTGPGGRIIEADLQAHQSVGPTGTSRLVELTSIERRTGERMQASAREIPSFALEVEIDMGGVRERKTRETSYTALILEAVAGALAETPRLNAHYLDGELRGYSAVHLGVAVATEKGLLVPTIPDADQLDAAGLQAILTQFREKARSAQFTAADLSPATFTVSNLGGFGVDRFQALINPPQTGILAIGRIAERPLVRDGTLAPGWTLFATLTADHRAVDGATAAPFLTRLRDTLESPE